MMTSIEKGPEVSQEVKKEEVIQSKLKEWFLGGKVDSFWSDDPELKSLGITEDDMNAALERLKK